MYAREIGRKEHTFGVSGKLIMNALVMYDHQTRTLWSQFLGTGVKGPQAGVELEFVPVIHTTWSLWVNAHPNTRVLDKGGRYAFDSYEFYYKDGKPGVIGEARKDPRLPRKALVVGVEVGDSTKAYPFHLLAEEGIVNDTVDGAGVLVYMDRPTETALAYDRRVDGKALTFRSSGDGEGAEATLIDDETGTTWIALTGLAVEGPLKGKRLERALSHLSFWFAWKDWNPETELYGEVSEAPDA